MNTKSQVPNPQLQTLPAVQQRKHEALEYFTRRLREHPTGAKVAKIMLFGSLARGEAEEHSDIDVLVFALDEVETVRDACAEIAFETAMETGEGVEALVYPLHRFYEITTYFLYRASRYGVEVYSMNEQALKRHEGESLLRLADEYRSEAERALAAQDLRIAIDAAYDAAELCAKALLLLKLDQLPGSHGGIVAKFGELYVKSGDLPHTLGRGLNRGLQARAHARYDYTAQITIEAAQEVLGLAQEMLRQSPRMVQQAN